MKLFGIALLAVLAAAGLPGIGPARAAAPAAPPRCENIQLYIRAQGGQGAAGTIGVLYRLNNLWGRPCSMYGYPGVQLLDRSFHSLPTATHRGGGTLITAISPRPVIVPAHGHAYFALSYSDVPVGRPCQPPARYIMVIPPNDHLPVVTYASPHGGSLYSCTGDIHVSPVESQPRL